MTYDMAMDRREAAYWLTLAFHLGVRQRRDLNGLALLGARKHGLGLEDLVRLDPQELPGDLQRFSEIHRLLIAAEGRASAQAFVIDRLAERGFVVLPITDPRYPRHVKERLSPGAAPTVLCVAGDVVMLSTPGVAVSGSRHAGPQGLAFARAVGRALAEAGVPVVSGLAPGVDREATDGALDAGGRVVGIAAEGILQARAARRKEIAEGRLTVVSEFAPEQKWAAGLAMARNRTIAGFSRALVVADCVAPGGTMNQVEVHLKLDLPVGIRRGEGEGAFVAKLASHPGVKPIPWDGGQLALPTWLPLNRGGIGARVEFEGTTARITLEVPAGADLEHVLDVVRRAWTASTSRHEGERECAASSGAPRPVSEEPPDSDGGTTEAGPGGEEPDPVMVALGADPRGLTVADLVRATSWTESRVRRHVETFVRAGVVVKRNGKQSSLYKLATDPDPAALPLFTRPLPAT